MSKKLFQGFVLIIGVMFFYGCASSGVEMRTYKEDRSRVDQEAQGNSGYLMGKSRTAEDAIKKTRRIYVLEFSKPAPEIGETKQAQADASTSFSGESSYQREIRPAIDEPAVPGLAPITQEFTEVKSLPALPVDYKVEKDDTLQKISKKFYDSYKKWPKIYEANKAKIKDPNHIKPGITITIPAQ